VNGSQPVVVAGDAIAFHREPRAASALTAMLASRPARAHRAGHDSGAGPAARVEELISGLRRIAPGVAAIYLVHTDQARARTAQEALAGTVPVITQEQAPLLAVPELLLGSSPNPRSRLTTSSASEPAALSSNRSGRECRSSNRQARANCTTAQESGGSVT
jgi:hypothetical protein